MPVLLILIFVGVPLLELVVILQVGGMIGGWATAGLLIADSIVGALLLRFEGRRAWSEFRRALSEGRWPGDEVAQGALIIVGGTLLVTPGFVTDAVGFLLLLAPTRGLVSRVVRRRLSEAGGIDANDQTSAGRSRRRPAAPDPSRRGGMGVEVVEIRREPVGPSPSTPSHPPSGGDAGPRDAGPPAQGPDEPGSPTR